ncbi:Serine/threonine-protein phosphatase 4 catalytic subunit [Cryptosporidium felis]|nr:Serine/threonine-protein phosphatase 4 catalytic subunit [Cryptosporidium felis]
MEKTSIVTESGTLNTSKALNDPVTYICGECGVDVSLLSHGATMQSNFVDPITFRADLGDVVSSHRVYSISGLLCLRRRFGKTYFFSAEEIYPFLPKLETRESKTIDFHSNLRYSRNLNDFYPFENKNFDIFGEIETPSNKGCFSCSDISSLLEKFPAKAHKVTNDKNADMSSYPILKASEEPLTSRMVSRLKQIAIGKSLPEYKNYIKKVPIESRSSEDPQTPRCDLRLTKKEFNNLYREWRVKLHQYENDSLSGAPTRENTPENSPYCSYGQFYGIESLKI